MNYSNAHPNVQSSAWTSPTYALTWVVIFSKCARSSLTISPLHSPRKGNTLSKCFFATQTGPTKMMAQHLFRTNRQKNIVLQRNILLHIVFLHECMLRRRLVPVEREPHPTESIEGVVLESFSAESPQCVFYYGAVLEHGCQCPCLGTPSGLCRLADECGAGMAAHLLGIAAAGVGMEAEEGLQLGSSLPTRGPDLPEVSAQKFSCVGLAS